MCLYKHNLVDKTLITILKMDTSTFYFCHDWYKFDHILLQIDLKMSSRNIPIVCG